MRRKDKKLAEEIERGLDRYDRKVRPLLGIKKPSHKEALIEQILESVHRIKYVSTIKARPISALREDPSSELFDPLKAAILCQRRGQIDEAFWFVFYFVHFGKSLRTKWELAREVYLGHGTNHAWDWQSVSRDPAAFRRWLRANLERLKSGRPRHFGNHRKYQSLDADSPNGTGAAFESYVNWVKQYGSHQALIADAIKKCGEDRRAAFDYLYRSMSAVASFGRTARFDYLTMLGKLDLAPIEPGSTYMNGATGPYAGGCLLFKANKQPNRKTLDLWLVELDAELKLGMQVLEDSLCNWQKSPHKFVAFRG